MMIIISANSGKVVSIDSVVKDIQPVANEGGTQTLRPESDSPE